MLVKRIIARQDCHRLMPSDHRGREGIYSNPLQVRHGVAQVMEHEILNPWVSAYPRQNFSDGLATLPTPCEHILKHAGPRH